MPSADRGLGQYIKANQEQQPVDITALTVDDRALAVLRSRAQQQLRPLNLSGWGVGVSAPQDTEQAGQRDYPDGYPDYEPRRGQRDARKHRITGRAIGGLAAAGIALVAVGGGTAYAYRHHQATESASRATAALQLSKHKPVMNNVVPCGAAVADIKLSNGFADIRLPIKLYEQAAPTTPVDAYYHMNAYRVPQKVGVTACRLGGSGASAKQFASYSVKDGKYVVDRSKIELDVAVTDPKATCPTYTNITPGLALSCLYAVDGLYIGTYTNPAEGTQVTSDVAKALATEKIGTAVQPKTDAASKALLAKYLTTKVTNKVTQSRPTTSASDIVAPKLDAGGLQTIESTSVVGNCESPLVDAANAIVAGYMGMPVSRLKFIGSYGQLKQKVKDPAAQKSALASKDVATLNYAPSCSVMAAPPKQLAQKG